MALVHALRGAAGPARADPHDWIAAGVDHCGQTPWPVATLVPMSDPVAAIDVDKVADHILAEHILIDRETFARSNMAT